MRCPSCGAMLPEQSFRHCVLCGTPLPAGEAPTAGPQSPPADHFRPPPGKWGYQPPQAGYQPPDTGHPTQASYQPPGAGHPTQAYPPPEAGFPAQAGYPERPGFPPLPPPRRRSRGLVTVAAVVLAVGAGMLLLLGQRGPSQAAPAPVPASSSGGTVQGSGSSRAEATQLAQLTSEIQRSQAARAVVIRATQRVGGCSMASAHGISQLNQAVRLRRRILHRLTALRLPAVPGGKRLVSSFQQVLRQSILADQGFIGWMRDISKARKCPIKTAKDAPYQAGLRASSAAVLAKEAFLSKWNPLASRFGQPTFAQTQI